MTRTTLRQCQQRGLTLVELMVAMAVGLVIALALLLLLSNASRNSAELAKTSKLIDSGRIAMLLLESDVRHAGYWGGYIPQYDDLLYPKVPTDVPTDVPDPCMAYAAWTAAHMTNLLGVPVQGYEIADPVPAPALGVCAGVVTSPKPSTDVLVVRHAELAPTAVAALDGNLYIQVAKCGEARPDVGYVLGTAAAAFTLTQKDCATQAQLRRFVSNIYYVRNYANAAGDSVPTLVRSTFGLSGGLLQHQAAQALVEGVEGFRIEYGVDDISRTDEAVNLAAAVSWTDPGKQQGPKNRGDGAVDGDYLRCTTLAPCTAAKLANAVAVKIHVLMRNDTTTPGYVDAKTYQLGETTLGPFNDGYKRHLFTQTIRLVNPSSRREAL